MQGATSIDLVTAATIRMKAEDAAAIIVKTGLTHAEQVQILMAHGLTEAEAEAMLATASHTAATATATATTSGLTVATSSLKAAVHGLNAALKANPFILLIAGAVAAIAAFKTFYDSADKAAEKARELADTSISNAKDSKSKQNELDSLISKYQELKSREEQDASTRAEILQVQTDINKLVGRQGDGLDLVNGKLEDELEKLRSIAQINLEGSIPTFEKAYLDTAEATEKTNYDNNSDWVRDYGIFKKQHDAETKIVDANSELKSALQKIYEDTESSAIKGFIDELENGSLGDTHLALVEGIVNEIEGIADADREAAQTAIDAIKSGQGSYEITVGDITNELENFAKMSHAERLEAVRNALDYMEGIDGFDYQNDDLWKKLVEVESTLAGSDGTFTKQVEAASELLEALTKKEVGAGETLSDIDDYFAYKQKIVDSIMGNNVIQQAIEDGALTAEGIEAYVDSYLGTLDKYSDLYESLQPENTNKLNFSELLQTEKFSNAVDSYIDDVSKLQEALNKIKKGDFGNEDFVELIKLFPQLASEADDLEGGIVSLLNSMNSDMADKFASQFGNMETDEDVAALKNFQDAVLELGKVVGNTQFAIDIEAETDGMDKLYSAMKESVSSTGLTAESIKNLKARYQDLENYDAATLFEKTANGIHLNTKALRELEAAYEKQEKANIKNTLDDLIEQYNDLTKQIEGASDEASRAELYKKRSDILDQINDTAELASMYDGLTSAFKRWEEAQNIGEEGDMYDSLADGLEHIKELYDEGLIGTNEFRAAVQLMSNEDLSTANIDELLAAYQNGYGLMTRYFQDSSDGCLNFLRDVQNLNSEWAHMNEDGSWEINFGVGNDQEIADAIGINVESVQAIMRKLSDYGFDINLDSIFSQLDNLQSRAEEANEALIKIGATDIVFNFGTEDLDSLNEQIGQAKDLLDSLYNDNGELNVKYNEDDVENAIAIIERLIYRKQSLDDAAILKVDTSNADNDITNIISKLQEFKSSYNNLEVQTAIGADTTEAKTACDGLLTEISGLDAEILATLGIDTTSLDTLNESINSITPELMVKAGLDASLIEGYQAEEHTADGTVIWDNNIDKVTSWINQSHTARGEVKWYNNTYNVKTHFTASGTINWSGGGRAQGTAFSSGYWGTRNSGIALGGEVGQELVVRDGKFFTVGDNGAEMFQYKKDDIIFNAEQTRQILANGRIANGKKRGVTYAQGTAFSGGSGRITGSGKVVTTPSGGGSSGGSSSGGSSDSSKEDEPKVIDWIEVAINRIERAIDRLKTTAESTYKSLKKRLGATYDEITKVNQELSLQQKAHDRYMQQANSVGLSSDLAKKVQDGTIDISEYDSETAELISDYQDWYEKALDCADAIQELHENLASLYEDNFNNVKDDFDNQLSLLEHLTNTYNTGIDMLEAKGYMASTEYYKALQKVTKQNISVMNKELSSLEQKFSEAMASGEIEEGSEAWYEMQQAINEVKDSIAEANVQLAEYEKTMREINWERFDYVQDRISQITKEADFLIDLMSNSDLYDDRGQLSDNGLATMGLHAANYNVYMSQADKYAQEILKLDKEIANDPYNTDLIARREELLGLQQDSIKAAEDEKQAIVDMVRNGIEIELSALKELIDAYKESLDNAKSLYDYQSKVADKSKEIASLQKQLSAYSGDTSEETRATVQKLQVDLSKAQEDLAKTEYEQFISDQKKLLDELYTEYEEILNQRLDDVDALISDMIDTVNLNSDTINTTLGNIAADVGYTLTPQMQAIWDGSTGALDGTITKYGDKFEEQNTAVKSVLDSISANVAAMVAESEKEATSTTSSTSSTTTPSKPSTPSTPSTPSSSTSSSSSTPKRTDKENYGVALAIINGNYGWGTGDTRKKNLQAKGFDYNTVQGIVNKLIKEGYVNSGAWVGRYYGIKDLSPYNIKKFKLGGLVDYTGLAQLDGTPNKPELVLNSEDTENFIALRDVLRAMSAQAVTLGGSYNFGSTPSLRGISDISGILATMRTSNGNMGTTFGDFEINIPIEKVEDYNDFVRQLQRDDQFEKMILSMTVDRIAGKSSLEKYKYRW